MVSLYEQILKNTDSTVKANIKEMQEQAEDFMEYIIEENDRFSNFRK
jgi:hypothetical protein